MKTLWSAAALGGILALATLLRVSSLAEIPPFVHGDEAECGLEAIRLLRQGFQGLFQLGWYGIPNFSFAVSSPFLAAFGESLWSLRFASAMAGVACVALLFGLGRELFGTRVGLLAALILAVSFPHVAYSRLGENYMQAATQNVAAIWAVVAAARRRSRGRLLLAGCVTGLAFLLYPAAHLVVPLAFLILLFEGRLRSRHFLSDAAAVGWLALGVVLVTAPLTPLFGGSWDWLQSRSEQVVIWHNWNHVAAGYGGDRFAAVLGQITRTLLVFTSERDHNTQFGAAGGALGTAEALLFFLGLVLLPRHGRGLGTLLLPAWILALLFASVLTVDAPTYQRLISLFPATALVMAVALDWLIERFSDDRSGRFAARAAVAALAAGVALTNTQRFFGDYAPVFAGNVHTEVARAVAALSPPRTVYLDCTRYLSASYAAVRFLAPGSRATDLIPGQIPQAAGPIAFVLCSGGAQEPGPIEERYPGGSITRHLTSDGRQLFSSYVVPPSVWGPERILSPPRTPEWVALLPPAAPFLGLGLGFLAAASIPRIGRRLRQTLFKVSRLPALAATVVVGSLLLPLAVDREHVRLERRHGEWTVHVDGRRLGSLTDAGAPWSVRRAALFLSGGGEQCWQRVSLSTGIGGDLRPFTLGHDPAPWTFEGGPWRTSLLGTCPAGPGESRVELDLPEIAGDLAVEATLAAGSEGGIVLESGDGEDRVRLWMRPRRHHDALFTLEERGHPQQSLPVGPVGVAAFGSFLAALHAFLWALLPGAAVAFVILAVERRRGRVAAASPPRRAGAVVAVAAGVLFAATLHLERGVLEAMPHVQDAVSLIFQARNFAMGRLASPSPVEPRFFDHEFIINDGRWFGKHSPGASLLYAAALRVDALDLVNPLLGAGSVVLLFLLASRVYGRTEGLLAAGLAASSPFVWQIGASYLSHPAALFFVLVFLVAMTGPPTLTRWSLAGLALGAVFLTRPQTAVPLGAPFACLALAETMRAPESRPRWIACGVGASAGVLLSLAYNRALSGSIWVSPFQMYSPWDHLGFGPVGVEWPLDFGIGQAFGNWTTDFELLGPTASALGWMLLPLGFLPWLLRPLQRNELLLGSGALGVVCLFFFYFHGGVFLGPRYWYEILPVVFLSAARGLTLLGEAVATVLPERFPRGHVAAMLALVAGAVLMAQTVRMALEQAPELRGLNGVSRRLLAESEAIPGRALVFVDSESSWQPYGAVFWTLWPELERNRIIYARTDGVYNVHPERQRIPISRLVAHFPARAVYRWSAGQLVPIGDPVTAPDR